MVVWGKFGDSLRRLTIFAFVWRWVSVLTLLMLLKSALIRHAYGSLKL